MRSLLTILLAGSVLCGCNGGGDAQLPKSKESELRNNFSRALTPEEVAKMNGGGATKGADTPKK